MDYNEIKNQISSLTNCNISNSELAKALCRDRSNISYKQKNGNSVTDEDFKKFADYFKIDLNLLRGVDGNVANPLLNTTNKPAGCTGDCRTCNNARILAQQVEIDYMDELPESEKLPEITSLHTDMELITNHWHRQPENLRIIPMQGDNLSTYFYPCKNRDILIVDIGSRVATREGIYVYSARNNTMIFVAKLNQLMDGTIRIEKFEASGEVMEKLVTLEKQKEVDFRILGRVVKNASLSL